MKQNDFDYMQMLKGELYYAPTILPENKSTNQSTSYRQCERNCGPRKRIIRKNWQ